MVLWLLWSCGSYDPVAPMILCLLWSCGSNGPVANTLSSAYISLTRVSTDSINSHSLKVLRRNYFYFCFYIITLEQFLFNKCVLKRFSIKRLFWWIYCVENKMGILTMGIGIGIFEWLIRLNSWSHHSFYIEFSGKFIITQ